MNRGRRGEEIFTGKKDYTAFIELLKELVEDYRVKIAVYCLLSNHYHLLVQTPEANLSRAMRHVNGVYTQRFNKINHCNGQLFQGRFKSILVDADRYLLELVRYIHKNPLESGRVDNINNYTWSSHKAYLSGAKKWDWLHKKYILSLFSTNTGESIREYTQFVSKEIPKELTQILARKKLPAIIGSEGFVDKIKMVFFSDTQHEEIPESRYLAPDRDTIINEVCTFYHVTKDFLFFLKKRIL